MSVLIKGGTIVTSEHSWQSDVLCDGGKIREIGPDAVHALPFLIGALSDENTQVRVGAAAGLGGLGPAATPAVPALIAALADEHRFVRSWVAMALNEIGPAAAAAAAGTLTQRRDLEAAQRAGSGTGRPRRQPVRRSASVVGRNEPCPCASGKKYKHCCGKRG